MAIAEYGRIEKTIHTLNFIDDEFMRRATLAQLNFGEGRHALARDVFHGKRGELHQRYREGQDQLSALGLVINMIVYWNTLYMNAALVHGFMECVNGIFEIFPKKNCSNTSTMGYSGVLNVEWIALL